MTSHYNDPRFGSQNLGNQIGTKSSVRQSKLYRIHESGNTMKQLMGQENLIWDVNNKQGAYSGKVYDHQEDEAKRVGPKHTTSQHRDR